jgi:hypothetical protein
VAGSSDVCRISAVTEEVLNKVRRLKSIRIPVPLLLRPFKVDEERFSRGWASNCFDEFNWKMGKKIFTVSYGRRVHDPCFSCTLAGEPSKKNDEGKGKAVPGKGTAKNMWPPVKQFRYDKAVIFSPHLEHNSKPFIWIQASEISKAFPFPFVTGNPNHRTRRQSSQEDGHQRSSYTQRRHTSYASSGDGQVYSKNRQYSPWSSHDNGEYYWQRELHDPIADVSKGVGKSVNVLLPCNDAEKFFTRSKF